MRSPADRPQTSPLTLPPVTHARGSSCPQCGRAAGSNCGIVSWRTVVLYRRPQCGQQPQPSPRLRFVRACSDDSKSKFTDQESRPDPKSLTVHETAVGPLRGGPWLPQRSERSVDNGDQRCGNARRFQRCRARSRRRQGDAALSQRGARRHLESVRHGDCRLPGAQGQRRRWAEFEAARASAEIARKVYELRTQAKLTQRNSRCWTYPGFVDG